MKINDEGTSNAAHWHERAMKAEARLAEAERERDEAHTLWAQDRARLAEALKRIEELEKARD